MNYLKTISLKTEQLMIVSFFLYRDHRSSFG